MSAWNRVAAALMVILFLASVRAEADPGKPVENFAAWEEAFVTCLQSADFPCVVDIIADHLASDAPSVRKQLGDTVDVVEDWLDTDDVYRVFDLLNDQIGDRYVRRLFLVEDTTGADLSIYIVFTNSLGNWYITSVDVSTDETDLEQLLGVTL